MMHQTPSPAIVPSPGVASTIESDWSRIVSMTLLGMCFVTALSFVAFGLGLQSTLLSGAIGALIAAICFGSAFWMISAGATLAALPHFLIGCGIFFGVGTMLMADEAGGVEALFFTEGEQREIMAKLNAINALAITVAISTAALMCGNMRLRKHGPPGLAAVLNKMHSGIGILILVGLFITIVTWLTFPQPSNLLLVALLSMLRAVPLFAVLIGAAVWVRLSTASRIAIILITVLTALHGLLSLWKLQTMLPIGLLGLGWWMGRTNRATTIILFSLVGIAYFSGFAELVNLSRVHVNFDWVENSATDRINILSDTLITILNAQASGDVERLLLRFSPAPFAAHFISLYDTGSPGDTLSNIPVALTPRILWPEKPILNPGGEFDLAFRDYQTTSNLAIGFIAEAYWNLGWFGLVICSAVVGLEIGWFTRKWLLLMEHGVPHLGIFLFSPLIVRASLSTETNLVVGYFSGMVKTMIAIMLTDILIRTYLGYRDARRI